MTSRPTNLAAVPQRPLTLVTEESADWVDAAFVDIAFLDDVVASEDVPADGRTHASPQPVLVASVEPGVVFASLAARCVPDLCDECTVDLAEGPHAKYRVESPPQGLQRLAGRAANAPLNQVRIPFAHPAIRSAAEQDDLDLAALNDGEFRGVATFTWHHRTPSRADGMLAAVFVDHAVQTVLWQCSDSAAVAAASNIDRLRIALETNRHIGVAVGILMSLHKITQEQALEMLRMVSQDINRKVRDLALDVIDTGWLDPASHTSRC